MRKRTELLVVHSSATPPGMDVGVAEIRDWHVAPRPKGNGWRDIGYQFVVRRSGAVEAGRDMDVAGAHTMNQNYRSVGVCVVGGIDLKGNPEANFTAAQYESLEVLLKLLSRAYPDAVVRGHRDFAATVCPSFDVVKWAYVRGLPT